MRARKSLFLTSAVLFSLVILVGLLSHSSQAQESEIEMPNSVPLEESLRDVLLTEGRADLVVVMAERPDLSGASVINNWNERGRYVYDTLRDLADRSQAPVQHYLKQTGLTYRSFLSNNTVYVEDGDLAAAEAVARLPGVALIRLPEVATIQPGVQLSIPPTESYGWNLDALESPIPGQS
jgi:hypothetical protein